MPPFWEISLTKLRKLKISTTTKKQIPWNGGFFNVFTPDKVTETIKLCDNLSLKSKFFDSKLKLS